jgi:inositol transport system substrate-binding protein
MRWKLGTLVCAALAILFLAPSAMASPKQIRIGLSMQEMTEYLTVLTDACKTRAEELGVDLVVANAGGNIEKQINDTEDFITKKLDAIILSPIDAVGLNNTVDKVADSGIPLVLINTITTNQRFTTYSGSDNVQCGRLEGEYLRKLLGGKGNIIIFEGVAGHSVAIARTQGLMESLVNYPGSKIKVLASTPTEHWSREVALAQMQAYLRIFPNIDAVASNSDQLSLGIVQAIEESGRKGILVGGVDAMPDALTAVKEGRMFATVFQDAKGQARNAVDAAVKLAKGEKVPKNIYVPFELVTKTNVDQYTQRNQ